MEINDKSMKRVPESAYEKDRRFYMTSFLARKEIAETLNDSQRKVVSYLIDNLNFSLDIVIGTYNTIIKGARVSRATVAYALKQLELLSLIKKRSNIIYFNPDAILTGNRHKQIKLKKIYDNV